MALNHLHDFFFNGRCAQCSALLSQLQLPQDVRVQLLGDLLRTPDNAFVAPAGTKALMSLLPENIRHSDFLSSIRFVWLKVWGEYFVLTADPKQLDKRNKQLTIFVMLEAPEEDHYDVFAPNVLSELPLIFHDSLTSLHVESGGLSSLCRAQWTALFTSFPHLIHVRLRSRTPLTEGFFKALGCSGHSPPCSKLKLLSLRCELGAEVAIEKMLEGLHECAEDRSRAGARLAHLKVAIPSSPSRWEEHASRLEALVDVLTFDDADSTQPD